MNNLFICLFKIIAIGLVNRLVEFIDHIKLNERKLLECILIIRFSKSDTNYIEGAIDTNLICFFLL